MTTYPADLYRSRRPSNRDRLRVESLQATTEEGRRDCELVRSVPGLDQVVELDLPCMAEKGDEVIPFFAYKFAMIGMMSSEIFV